jgi:hypothetical protein
MCGLVGVGEKTAPGTLHGNILIATSPNYIEVASRTSCIEIFCTSPRIDDTIQFKR